MKRWSAWPGSPSAATRTPWTRRPATPPRRTGPTTDPARIAEALSARLIAAARAGERPTYGAVSQELELPPPRVQALAALLEAGMAADAAAGLPFLAAVMKARLNPLPARGFFQTARALGRYDGPDDGPEAEAYHAAELARLRAAWAA